MASRTRPFIGLATVCARGRPLHFLVDAVHFALLVHAHAYVGTTVFVHVARVEGNEDEACFFFLSFSLATRLLWEVQKKNPRCRRRSRNAFG